MRLRQLLHLILQRDLIVRSLVHHFVQNEVLFAQVGHTILRLLPLILPEFNCQSLVFRV